MARARRTGRGVARPDKTPSNNPFATVLAAAAASSSSLQAVRRIVEFFEPAKVISTSASGDASEWVKLSVDIKHKDAWNVVGILAVFNGDDPKDYRPSRFVPVSPPPKLNGGPEKYLAWVIEERAVTNSKGSKTKRWDLEPLLQFLARVPLVSIVASEATAERWWVRFEVAERPRQLAWSVVQSLGHVLNYVSLLERLPTELVPMDSPKKRQLTWVVRPVADKVDPGWIAEFLAARLPTPADDKKAWVTAG